MFPHVLGEENLFLRKNHLIRLASRLALGLKRLALVFNRLSSPKTCLILRQIWSSSTQCSPCLEAILKGPTYSPRTAFQTDNAIFAPKLDDSNSNLMCPSRQHRCSVAIVPYKSHITGDQTPCFDGGGPGGRGCQIARQCASKRVCSIGGDPSRIVAPYSATGHLVIARVDHTLTKARDRTVSSRGVLSASRIC